MEDNGSHRAIEICDRMLEVTRAAYLAQDFEAFAQHFQLPHDIGTFEHESQIKDRTELRATFNRMCAQMTALGVIDLYRKTINAQFRDAHTIQATFLSRHVLKGAVFGDEVISHGIMRHVGDRWLITESRYATMSSTISHALIPGNPNKNDG